MLGGSDDPVDGIGLIPSTNSIISSTVNGKIPTTSASNNQDLLDLLGGLDIPVSTPPAAIAPLGGVGLDLNSLNDNSIKSTSTTVPAIPLVSGSSSFGGLDNLLNSNLTSPTAAPTITMPPATGGVTSPLGNNTGLFGDFSSINNNEVCVNVV